MRDIMVDLETTGTNPNTAAIIQIAAVRFNYETEEIDSDMFDRCLQIPGHRVWDMDTAAWWRKQGDVLPGLLARAEPPRKVLEDFWGWIQKGTIDPILWAKPTSFEFPFIQGYYRDYDLPMPFGYREAVDLNSFIRGSAQNSAQGPLDKTMPFEGPPHNAIFDVLHQIKCAFAAKTLVK